MLYDGARAMRETFGMFMKLIGVSAGEATGGGSQDLTSTLNILPLCIAYLTRRSLRTTSPFSFPLLILTPPSATLYSQFANIHLPLSPPPEFAPVVIQPLGQGSSHLTTPSLSHAWWVTTQDGERRLVSLEARVILILSPFPLCTFSIVAGSGIESNATRPYQAGSTTAAALAPRSRQPEMSGVRSVRLSRNRGSVILIGSMDFPIDSTHRPGCRAAACPTDRRSGG